MEKELIIMNQKVLHTLEYDKIIEKLTEFAFSQDAKEKCRHLLPMTELSPIIQAQQQTKQSFHHFAPSSMVKV